METCPKSIWGHRRHQKSQKTSVFVQKWLKIHVNRSWLWFPITFQSNHVSWLRIWIKPCFDDTNNAIYAALRAEIDLGRMESLEQRLVIVSVDDRINHLRSHYRTRFPTKICLSFYELKRFLHFFNSLEGVRNLNSFSEAFKRAKIEIYFYEN